ncbi:MAG: glutamate racemase [Betaproteobacteria bacterium]
MNKPLQNVTPRTIGIFDSGIGGISILRAIRNLLPNDDLIYVADSLYLPYGTKTPSWIKQRSIAICKFLERENSNAIVVACNTATGAAISSLRESFNLPIIGIEPALKPAAESTKTGAVGILATAGTLASDKYDQLKTKFARDLVIINQPCHGMVELIETGNWNSAELKTLASQFLEPMMQASVDKIVLGCTHYPFIRDAIQEIVGNGVELIDPSIPVASELKRRLEIENIINNKLSPGEMRFYVTGERDRFKVIVDKFLNVDAKVNSIEI